MATQATAYDAEIFKREQLEQFTQDWHRTLTAARDLLFNQEWQQAVLYYWRAYPLAEQLLNHSNCRNCALKA